nr:histidine kinase [uncultured Noviherbaspirillum sp.]
MDKRIVSRLIRGSGILALVTMAALAGGDALRSARSMQEAGVQLARTQQYLNDLTLALFDAGQPLSGSSEPVGPALAGLEREADSEPALRRQVRELQGQVQAYREARPGMRTAQAGQIPGLVTAIQASAERRAADRYAALSRRLHAGLAGAALACLLLGALGAAWRSDRRRAASAGKHAGLLREALEKLPFAMAVADRNGQPVLVNAAARELWQDNPGQPREWRRADLELRPENRALYQALQSGCSRGREAVNIVAQDGDTQRLVVTAIPLRTAAHEVAGAFAIYFDSALPSRYAGFQDAAIPAEQLPALRPGDQNASEAAKDMQPSQVYLLDRDGVIIALNQPANDAGGVDRRGASYLAVCDASAARGVPEAARIAAGIRSVISGDVPTFSIEYVCRNETCHFWSRATVSRMVENTNLYVVVVHENITQHKATESALRESALSMRELAEHQESVREEERKRIAREIHDELGQQLLALKIDVSILQGQLSHVPEATAQLDGMLRSMSSLMQSMRSIINDLRPAVLDLGLHAAVEWQTREFQRKTGISCALMSDGEDIVLSDACATALFRTLQESLTNVSRHASASHVDVQLYATDDSLLMRVSDDGIGRLGQQDKPDAFGLRGMRERIGSLGGRLTVTAAPDQGVTVTAIIPIKPGLQLVQPGYDRRSATDRRARARTA